ncbi:MAG TPA: cytochrome P450 [Acidimicrobiia bacterium]|nr:cytochrome P450 [Acidimicrobiia bacterium]
MSVSTTPVEFDPFSEEFFNNPYELYRRLRDEAPVYFSERYGFYALSRFADVLAAHRDWEAFSSAHGVELFLLSKDPEEVRSYRNIIMMDPPEHDRFRALVSRVFTPRAVTALEPMIRDVVCSFLDPLNDAREFDAVADFAAPFPVEVISRMLGVPEGDRQQIRHRIDLTLHREPGQMAPSPENQQAVLENGIYFHELTVEKRKNPGDDMLSRLTQVTVDRGDGEETGLDDAEITGFASLLGGAGAETVTKLVGNAVVLFGRHRDQWQKILDDHDKIPRAVDEILRYWPPSQYQGRFCVEEHELESGTVPAGFPVLLITGAATRDARAFERADEFDIERQPGITIGFGHGVHSCLGAALARMESRIAIEELASRWRRLEVDEAGLRRVQMANVAGYSNVPVRVVR